VQLHPVEPALDRQLRGGREGGITSSISSEVIACAGSAPVGERMSLNAHSGISSLLASDRKAAPKCMSWISTRAPCRCSRSAICASFGRRSSGS
jgi:hypothetical protein